jgi:hypothetical protein
VSQDSRTIVTIAGALHKTSYRTSHAITHLRFGESAETMVGNWGDETVTAPDSKTVEFKEGVETITVWVAGTLVFLRIENPQKVHEKFTKLYWKLKQPFMPVKVNREVTMKMRELYVILACEVAEAAAARGVIWDMIQDQKFL